MINQIEVEIIHHFIKETKQERILWELNLPKKREKVIWKFAGSEIFKRDCLTPAKYMDAVSMEKYFFSNTKTGSVYFIGEDYIGELTIKEATHRAQEGEICIIYCGNGIGYYQGEGTSRPRRFLLSKK